jgi:tRNA(fMet)-specific endonuclease VapC
VRVALDTNRYGDFLAGRAESVELLETASAVLVPFVVVGELRAGFGAGKRAAENEHRLRRFLAKEGVSVVYADDQTTQHYASVFRQLRDQGTPIPTNDMWIAALVMQHNLVLHHRDRHFDNLPQLMTV